MEHLYRLIFYNSKVLLRDRKKLIKDRKNLGFIEEALGKLAINPFANYLPIKKLYAGEEGVFRLRCGKWRILYDVDIKNKIIIVYRIKQRKEGY